MKKHSLLSLFLFLLGGMALIAAACGSSDDDSSIDVASGTTAETANVTTTTEQQKTPYDVPGDLELLLPLDEQEAGVILDSEKLDLGSEAVGYRILYTSKSLKGETIAVSGYVVANSASPPEGGWPLIAWAHGTVGIADQCAPSHDVDSEVALWGTLLEAGYAVVATDYEGLGTPGLHPYIVGESEARGVIDSVRAVQAGDLEGIEVTDEWVTLGHSQGGHAVMHVAQIIDDYAPDSGLLGAISGAPPSQFNLLYNVLVVGPFKGYIIMAVAAFEEAYSGVVLEDVIADEALALLPVLEEECLGGIFEAYTPLTREQISKVPDPLAVEPFKTIAAENDPQSKPLQVPLLIIHGEEDEQIPLISSQFLVGQLCALDNTAFIQRNTYPGEMHSSALTKAIPDILEWTSARFAGETPPPGCS